ncbi:SGNH hydrolase-type esterase domain-containing protein [Fennellomyces sp. T-0311]|nr:SGNH hydrolase-type esterase domain-containing protein [Fennellomyces sp. T-0311]
MNRIVLLSLLVHAAVVSAYYAACDADPPQIYPPSNLTLGGVPCRQGIFHNIVTFGDSWTDNGLAPITEDVYATGPFHGRQTNGPVWVEYLSLFLGADTYGFSYSGATANNTITPRGAPDILRQMRLFENSNTLLDSSTTLYTIWTGLNDLYEIYYNDSVPSQPEKLELVNQVIESIDYEARYALSTLSAQHLAIFGVAPIQHLPLFAREPDTENLENLVAAYNLGLRDVATKHSVRFIDTIPLFEKYLANENNTFADTTHPCVADTQEGRVQCANTRFNYLWWDYWHPSTKAHGILASDIFDILHA